MGGGRTKRLDCRAFDYFGGKTWTPPLRPPSSTAAPDFLWVSSFCQNVYVISSTTEVRWLDSADNALLDLHNSSDHTWPLGLIRSSWPHSIISTYHWVGNHKKYWSVAFI